MDNRAEIRDFLATRRAKITPDQVGLPAGERRRVPGLRREEVAVLAGVSTDWYTRLEKGHINGVSDDVLAAVARALQLTEAERAHLFNLARAAKPARIPRRRPKASIPLSVQRVLDSMTGTAAFVRNGRLDILGGNQLGRALYSPVLDEPAHRGNIARFNFFDPRAADYYPEYDGAMPVAVALLRAEAGRNPHDKDLTELVGELATRARRSASAGERTTCAPIAVAPRRSAAPSSATSNWRTCPWNSSPCPGSCSPHTPRNPPPHRPMHWPCSRLGPPPRHQPHETGQPADHPTDQTTPPQPGN